MRDLGLIGFGVIVGGRNQIIDRLCVTAAGARRWNGDDFRGRCNLLRDASQCRRPKIRRTAPIGLQENVNLPDRSLREQSAEVRLRPARERRLRINVGEVCEARGHRRNRRIDRRQRRTRRIGRLHEDFAAIDRRHELKADRAQRDEEQRENHRSAGDRGDRHRAAQRPRKRAPRIPLA